MPIALLLIISLTITIMALPLTSTYPPFRDSGDYFSIFAAYAGSWPLIPRTLPIHGGIPATSNVPPLLPWLMAMLNRVFGLSLFKVVKITPLLLYAFTAITLYFLAKELTRSRVMSLMAVLMYSTSKLYFSTVYPTYLMRAEFGYLFMMLFGLFVLRGIRQSSGNWKAGKSYLANIALAGLSLFAIVSTHDRSLTFFAVIIGVFLVVVFVFDRPEFHRTFRTVGLSLLLGILLATPVVIIWRQFFIERFLAVQTTATTPLQQSHIVDVIQLMGSVPYGYLVTCLALIGFAVIVMRESRTPGDYLLLSWFLPMSALANIHRFGVYNVALYPEATMPYVVVPISILAAIGLEYFVCWLEQKFTPFVAKRWLIPSLLTLIVVAQAYGAATTLTVSPKIVPTINEPMEEAILWLKSNSPSDCIIFTDEFAPHLGSFLIAGISGRDTISTPDPAMPAGEYTEYKRRLEAQAVITLQNPEETVRILLEYSLEHSAGYVFIRKTQIDWANQLGENISLERYNTYYLQVFENEEIVIYLVF